MKLEIILKEWEWEPLKEVELTVEVENTGSESEKVTVEVGLYNVDKGKFVRLSDDDRELSDSIRINDDDYEKFKFAFTLPADLDEDDEYRLYVKAYKKGDEEVKCVSKTNFDGGSSSVFSQKIDVVMDDEVGVDELVYSEVVYCGSTNAVNFKLYNFDLGDDEKMRVNLYSNALGIDLYSEEFELDEGRYEELFFDLTIPKDAMEKNYDIKVIVEYDYRESSDAFMSSNDDNSFSISVKENCEIQEDLNDTETTDSKDETPGFFSKITGSVVGMGDSDGWYLWVIGAVNVILVFSIIFVAVRMLRRSA